MTKSAPPEGNPSLKTETTHSGFLRIFLGFMILSTFIGLSLAGALFTKLFHLSIGHGFLNGFFIIFCTLTLLVPLGCMVKHHWKPT